MAEKLSAHIYNLTKEELAAAGDEIDEKVRKYQESHSGISYREALFCVSEPEEIPQVSSENSRKLFIYAAEKMAKENLSFRDALIEVSGEHSELVEIKEDMPEEK